MNNVDEEGYSQILDYDTSYRSHPLYTAPGDTPPNLLCTAQNDENRPQLPHPRVKDQTTSNTTSVKLKLPVWLESVKKLIIWLYWQ